MAWRMDESERWFRPEVLQRDHWEHAGGAASSAAANRDPRVSNCRRLHLSGFADFDPLSLIAIPPNYPLLARQSSKTQIYAMSPHRQMVSVAISGPFISMAFGGFKR